MFTSRTFWRAAACAWAVQIYWLSDSAVLTSDHTRSWLAQFLTRWIHWAPSESWVRLLGVTVRKTAHLCEYAFLAFLLFQALDGMRSPAIRRAIWSLCLAALYALTDEFHQAFVPGRGASFVDWSIDVSGAAAATAALLRLSPRPALR